MRIWDVHPRHLCDAHLSGEHRELHGLWNILTQGKRGYSQHPETLRWVGKLAALFARHELLVEEMDARGWNHKSPLDPSLASGPWYQDVLLDSVEVQFDLLRHKPCGCLRGLEEKKEQST